MARKTKETQSSEPLPPGAPLDRRTMEKTMADLHRLIEQQEFSSIEEMQAFISNLTAAGPLPKVVPDTPAGKAQELMYQAWEARTRNKRLKLARQALEIWPDCADAYVLLAEETAKTPEEARVLFEQGVQAGERAIGPENFKAWEGHFWGVLETRPYMRALEGLARALAALGEDQAAADRFREMLRLNPNDNQGVRYTLLYAFLAAGDDAGAERLFKQFKDDYSAWWLYGRALLEFRKSGKTKRATKWLKEAITYNLFVVLYLMGGKPFPKHLPEYYGVGDEAEAIYYTIDAVQAWVATPGAFEWLMDVVEAGPG